MPPRRYTGLARAQPGQDQPRSTGGLRLEQPAPLSEAASLPDALVQRFLRVVVDRPRELDKARPGRSALLPSKRTVPVSVRVAPSKIPVPPTTISVRLPRPSS